MDGSDREKVKKDTFSLYFSPVVLWIVNACERKPRQKEKKKIFKEEEEESTEIDE